VLNHYADTASCVIIPTLRHVHIRLCDDARYKDVLGTDLNAGSGMNVQVTIETMR